MSFPRQHEWKTIGEILLAWRVPMRQTAPHTRRYKRTCSILPLLPFTLRPSFMPYHILVLRLFLLLSPAADTSLITGKVYISGRLIK